MAEAEPQIQPEQTPPANLPPPTVTAISDEQAVELLNRLDEQAEPPPQSEPEPEPPKAEEPEEPEPERAEAEETPESEEPEEAPQEAEASAEEAEGETEEVDESIIDPPQSLSREDREKFRLLPREAQLRWLEAEEEISRRSQTRLSEADAKQRAAEAEQKAASEARQRYETALPQVLGMLNNELTTKFADIRTWDDVQRMRASNPNRYLEWDALTKQQQAVQADYQAAEQQKQQDAQQQFSRYVAEQDARFIEAFPDWGDAEKAPQLQKQARSLLQEVGYSEDEIAAAWQYGQPLSARDHRFQRMIAELVDLRGKYRKAKQSLERTKKAKPPPPVTKPGVASTKSDKESAQIEELYDKLSKSGRAEDAVAILAARGGG